MFIHIAEDGTLAINDLDNFRTFKVVCDHSCESGQNALASVGRVEADHLWVPANWIKCNGRPTDRDWLAGLEKMIAFAHKSGWVDDVGAVRAHIEFTHDN